MDIKPTQFLRQYFSGFQVLSHCKENNFRTNMIGALIVCSYLTVVVPVVLAVAYGLASLVNRIRPSKGDSPNERRVQSAVQNTLSLSRESLKDQPLSSSDNSIKVLHLYPGDLNSTKTSTITTEFESDNRLNIYFGGRSDFSVSIRREDIFESRAQVIVNAANSHLGGGAGIDGAIHKKGGQEYARAHQQLKNQHQGKYPLGYASMINSGLLKQNHQIDDVIVVAGPQGEATSQTEKQLYNCYYNSLALAHKQRKASIAFPSISTGIFSFPKERAAPIALRAIYDFITAFPDTSLKTISIHFLPHEGKEELELYQNTLKK